MDAMIQAGCATISPLAPASLRSQGNVKRCTLPLQRGHATSFCGSRIRQCRRTVPVHPSRGRKGCARAAAESSDVGGPLTPESPSGQLLKELLQNYPHLVPSAADQQLDLLSQQIEEEGKKEGGGDGPKGSEMVLYKRIEEMRRQERSRAVEEVMYHLVVQRFIEAGAPMLPQIPFLNLDPTQLNSLSFMGLMPSVPAKTRELESVHSPDALLMVQEHMDRVLGSRSGGIPGGSMMEDKVLVGTSKMKLGQVYAASIMYGYFLKRVDERFQLVRLLQSNPRVLGGPAGGEGRFEEERRARSAEFSVEAVEGEGDGERKGEEKSKNALREYVSTFDAATLQSKVALRSKEGLSIVERQTEALFGKPEVISLEGGVGMLKDDQTHITVSTLRRLILEAVAFGNFLWEVESYVDSRVKITI